MVALCRQFFIVQFQSVLSYAALFAHHRGFLIQRGRQARIRHCQNCYCVKDDCTQQHNIAGCCVRVCVCVCVCELGTWELRYGAPLISPTRAPREYLPCILISSLTGTLPWQQTWAAQILSALAWAQLAMLSGYRRMTVMRALHKAVRRVYAASPWWSENTMRAVYSVGHDLPCSRGTATAKLVHWLANRAVWEGDRYTDREIPEDPGGMQRVGGAQQ